MTQTTSQVFVEKTLVMQSQTTGQANTLTMKLQYIPQKRQVNISRALRQLQTCGIPVQSSQIFFMDIQKHVFVFLGNFPSKQEIFLSYQYILEEVLRIRYKKIYSEKSTQSKKKVRSKRKVKERTIREAYESVQKWRQIYNLTNQFGKKIHTLESAAQIVGIAKKTLDDYHANLRLAESYEFDFIRHMDDKIGVLRSFIKQHQRKNNSQPIIDDTDQFWATSSDSDEDKLC